MKHRGLYNITNVNSRVQKAGEEDGDVALDIDFTNTVHRSALFQIFDRQQINALVEGVYDEDGKNRNCGVKTITLDNEFRGTVRVDIGLDEWAVLSEAKIHKFKISPNSAGTFELKAQIQGVPSEGDLESIVRLQKKATELDFDVTPAVGGSDSASGQQPQMDLDDEADEGDMPGQVDQAA